MTFGPPCPPCRYDPCACEEGVRFQQAMNCPRGHGHLLFWDKKHNERSCLTCGFVWYADVIDPEEAKEDHRHGTAVRRPTSQGHPL